MENVSFNRLAELELNEAADYYDLESPGLGSAFLTQVERSLLSILEFPEAGPVIVGQIRRRLIPRFPYAILYSARGAAIRVLAVMNLRRRPMYWTGRE